MIDGVAKVDMKEKNLTDNDVRTPQRVANWLHEYNLWRKGEGSYAWNEDPNKNTPCPLTPKDLSTVIDKAIFFLNASR